MLSKLGLEKRFVTLDVLSLEVDRGSNVEVMQEIGYMEQDGVSGLFAISR